MATDAAHDLRALIEAEARGPCPAGYEGEDWFQLSEAEEEVFGIDPGRMPLLVAAWGAYEAFKAAAEGTDWDMRHQPAIDAARAARPELAAEPYGEEGWMRFAAAFSGLTLRDAWRWWSKNEAWQDRKRSLQATALRSCALA